MWNEFRTIIGCTRYRVYPIIETADTNHAANYKRPIITDIFSENFVISEKFVITLKNYHLSHRISDDLSFSLRPQNDLFQCVLYTFSTIIYFSKVMILSIGGTDYSYRY